MRLARAPFTSRVAAQGAKRVLHCAPRQARVCGIAGCVDFGARTTFEDLLAIARDMANRISYRGPDDSGTWADPTSGVALGHRRLSIIDLSPAGHQPMLSGDGRHALTYNGEIYNYLELQRELIALGHTFRGHSDTEVVLAAVRQWGLARALERFNGMFAFALWDREERTLSLARDRFGEKPLFYGCHRGVLMFGSELKALRAHPAFVDELDRSALTDFLRFGYVPVPQSIFRGIRKLPPGSWLTIRQEQDVGRTPTRYWSIEDVASSAIGSRFTGSEEDAASELERLLRESIRLRMIADVPLGAFLSGGLDSSTVVALMQAQSSRPVRTFTIGFHESSHNEAEAARAVATHLRTDHTELYVTPREAQAVIPRLPEMYDEPFADSSQIPTFLVAQLARRHVTVALSGDAGDELLGGYTRYFWAENVWRMVRFLPGPLRVWAARTVGSLASAGGGAWADAVGSRLPGRIRQTSPADKLQKLAGLFGVADSHELYLRLVSTWKEPAQVVVGGTEASFPLTRRAQSLGLTAFAEQMMLADTQSYLPDDILVKVDRATMAVSLEGRIPLLDPHVAAFAWSLPASMKVRDGKGKLPLRRVLAKYVPPSLFERPKMGFGVPIGAWLRGPLRDWAEALLDERRLRSEGFLNAEPVRQVWSDHSRGIRSAEYYIWVILMFQAWLESMRQPSSVKSPGFSAIGATAA
jgi:asparagine synthase (glutamine-hydrolysing)